MRRILPTGGRASHLAGAGHNTSCDEADELHLCEAVPLLSPFLQGDSCKVSLMMGASSQGQIQERSDELEVMVPSDETQGWVALVGGAQGWLLMAIGIVVSGACDRPQEPTAAARAGRAH
jgi:hypothetical protein